MPESWFAAVCTRLMTPALLALYGLPPAPERSPATDAVHTIEPPPCSRMTAAPYLIARNGPIRFTRSTSCQSTAVCSKNGTSPPPMPALA